MWIHAYNADTIKEKVAGIAAGKLFMSILSNPSKARKTKEGKELVLVQIEPSCFPAYYVVSLLKISAFRDALAESRKLTLDRVFQVDNVDF